MVSIPASVVAAGKRNSEEKDKRDQNGKWTGNYHPFRDWKFVYCMDFTYEEFQCFRVDIVELIREYLPVGGYISRRRDRIKQIVHYGLSKTWLPKFEQNLTQERAINLCERFIEDQSCHVESIKIKWSDSLPATFSTPRPALALTPEDRYERQEPDSIIDRPDLGRSKNSRGLKRERSESVLNANLPIRNKKQCRKPFASDNATWPRWKEVAIKISYRQVKQKTLSLKHQSLSLAVCRDDARFAAINNQGNPDNSDVAATCLSYAHLTKAIEEKLQAVGATLDMTKFRFKSMGYHQNRTTIETSAEFTAAFYAWCNEPKNRIVKLSTGMIDWWLLVVDKCESDAFDEEEDEMPDFDAQSASTKS